MATDVVLSWDANVDTITAGYKLYYKKDSLSLPFDGSDAVQGNSPVDIGNNTVAVLNDIDVNARYYFAVTAYDAGGNESNYSNIVAFNDSTLGSVIIVALNDLGSAVQQAASLYENQPNITIGANSTTFHENLVMNACNSNITIKGGVNLSNFSIAADTVIYGSLVVDCGTITVDGLTIS